MAKTVKVNYSPELTAELISRYQAGESIEDLGAFANKPPRSIISKLVREGVYVAAEKPVKTATDTGPTKKVLMQRLEELAPNLPFDGLMNATKEAIQALIDHLESIEASEADEDSEESLDESAAA